MVTIFCNAMEAGEKLSKAWLCSNRARYELPQYNFCRNKKMYCCAVHLHRVLQEKLVFPRDGLVEIRKLKKAGVDWI